jgi:hypothetical protein
LEKRKRGVKSLGRVNGLIIQDSILRICFKSFRCNHYIQPQKNPTFVKMRSMKTLIIASALLSMPLFARGPVINPIESLPDPAVVLLEGIIGDCTGSVVGLKPVTVITAKHCIAASADFLNQTKPKTIVTKNFKDEVFKAFEGVLPGDIAILIYEEPQEHFDSIKNLTKENLFHINTSLLTAGQKIDFCGYGGFQPIMNDFSAGKFHCGVNTLIVDDPSLNFLSEFPNDVDQKFDNYPSDQQKKILNSMVQDGLSTYGAGTRIGLTNFPGEKKESLIQTGDSGGPIFIRDEKGHKNLIAISSAGGAAIVNGVFRPVLGIGWRIDGDWTKAVLQEAKEKGADLN